MRDLSWPCTVLALASAHEPHVPRAAADAADGRRGRAGAGVAPDGVPGHQRHARASGPRRPRGCRTAIAELGYRRNQSRPAARARSTRGLIGVAIWGTSQYGPQQVLLALDAAARRAGYRLAVNTLHALDRARHPRGRRGAAPARRRGGGADHPARVGAAVRGRGRPRAADPRRRGRPVPGAADRRRRQRPGRASSRPGTCWSSVTTPSSRSPARRAGPRRTARVRGLAAGARGLGPAGAAAALGRRLERAERVRRRASRWRATRTSPRSSRPTTRWRSA